MKMFPPIETKGIEAGEDDLSTIEKVVAQFGEYHQENKGVFQAVNDKIGVLEKGLNQALTKLNRPNFVRGADVDEKLIEAKAQTLEFMRTGNIEGKTLSRASDPDGGLTIADQLDTVIQDQLIAISPIRSIARIVTLGAGIGDFKLPVGRRGASSAWVGESDTRPATNTPQLGLVTPSGGELMCYAKATQWLLDDSSFDMQAWLQSNISDEHAQKEGAAFIGGDGIKKPMGFLNPAPLATSDSTRTFGMLKYLPTGVAGDFAASNKFDKLIDLTMDLTAPYRANASWVMNSNTAGVVRKFKDGQGNYLWQQSVQAGQPDRMLNYPVVIAEDMPDIAANSLSIAFGDFKRGYLIVDKLGTRMVRDPYTQPGWVLLYVFKRVYGSVADSNAIRLLKFSVS